MRTTPYVEGSGFTLADGMYIPDVFIRTIVVILVFYVATSFLLTLIRQLLNHRLKSKLISQGRTVDEIEQILNTGAEHKAYAVKWFFLLLGAAIGFALISFRPFGWLSLAIIALGLALGCAAYYQYLKKTRS